MAVMHVKCSATMSLLALFLWLVLYYSYYSFTYKDKHKLDGRLFGMNGLSLRRSTIHRQRRRFFASRVLLYSNHLASKNLTNDLLIQSGNVHLNPGPESANRSYKLHRDPYNSLNVYCLNARSLCKKLPCLHDVVYGNCIDVLALGETWLTDQVSDHEIFPYGYKIIRRDRPSGKRGGGVLLAIKDTIVTEPTEFSSHSLELAAVVIKSRSQKILVAVCYRPPDASSEFLNELNRFLNFVDSSNFKDVVLLGDFNYPVA